MNAEKGDIPVKEESIKNNGPLNLILLTLQIVPNLNLGYPSREVIQ